VLVWVPSGQDDLYTTALSTSRRTPLWEPGIRSAGESLAESLWQIGCPARNLMW